MIFLKQRVLLALVAVIASTSYLSEAEAQSRLSSRRSATTSALSGGDMHLSFALSSVSAGQDDLNKIIDQSRADRGASTSRLGSAYEFLVDWGYRLSNSTYAIVFRPSYFMQSESGSGTGGKYDVDLSGFTIFPMFRVYPLENSFIRFYMQTGVGYGSLSGSVTAGARDLKFKGSAFGALAGVGVNFCFTDAHCLMLEGNMRYMPIERNLGTGGSCSSAGDIPGVTQCGNGSEVEIGNTDMMTTMSGIQGVIGYTMNF